MGIKLAKILVEVIDDSYLREDYSGRGMFGKTTAGFVVDNLADTMSAIINCADVFIDIEDGDVYPMFGDVRLKIDNMGKGYIIY
jgi:hypothetical protein